jgi:hypothetical protein
MRKFLGIALILGFVAFALSAGAQEENVVGMMVHVKPKAGMTDQWVEGGKKHMEFHRQKGDTWSWFVWQVISGDDTGDFLIGSFGHKWSDFDNMPVSEAEDQADYKATIEPYTESVSVGYSAFMAKHSLPPGEDAAPPKLLSVMTVYAKPEKVADYLNAVSKIPEALEKAQSPTRYWFSRVVAGGRLPAFTVVFPHENWAAIAPSGTPFRKMLEEAHGQTEADAILRSLSDAAYGSRNVILAYREDLSYIPAGPSSR